MYQNIYDSLGLIGIVIIIISFLSFYIFIERLSHFNKVSINAPSFVEGILNLLKSNKHNEAVTLCEETEGPVSTIIRSSLLQHNDNILRINNSISTVASLEIYSITKRMLLLKYIAVISSLLGLMGTLLSIVNNFDNALQANIPLDPSILISYYSYAIHTTILGFVVSIISFLLFTYLNYRILNIIYDMEWVAHKMNEFFIDYK